MQDIISLENIGSLFVLTVMEIVLGIDNIIFISIVAGKLPRSQQQQARLTGMTLAMLVRIAMLFAITWVMSLTRPLFTIGEYEVTVHGVILMTGGLFLIIKSVSEIHAKLEGHEEGREVKSLSLQSAIVQIVLLDIVFSFDSILTAIGIAKHVYIMIAAVVLSLGMMMFFAGAVSNFVNRHPSIKMLALAFLIMIGFLLTIEGLPEKLHVEIPKGYLYFAIAFAFAVEMLNIRVRKKSQHPVKLKEHRAEEKDKKD